MFLLSRVVCRFDDLPSPRNKLKGATAMLNMFSGGGSKSSAQADAEFEEDRDRLRDFQFKMLELQVNLTVSPSTAGRIVHLDHILI